MVLCWIALPVFAFLGIFSLKYRKLAKDSLECLFKTITLRKCSSGLDDKIRADITGTFMKYSPRGAKLFYKNYKLISFIVVILFIWSSYAGAIGMYNYVNYGNCNGPDSTGFCLLDPLGKNSGVSGSDLIVQGPMIFPVIESDDPIIGPENAELTIVEFGCFRCKYTKKAEATVAEVIEYYGGRVNFQFKTFPLPGHELSYEAALASECALEQGKYLEYHDRLFELQEVLTENSLIEIANGLNLNTDDFALCLEEEKYKESVDLDIEMGLNAQILGTPTFFINDKVIVGPKPFKTFKNIINKELKI